jgi:hypothetical protein
MVLRRRKLQESLAQHGRRLASFGALLMTLSNANSCRS